ncbi:hypothetical protein R1flu_010883 [Riccia fluitans]|uniref:AT-hook motif nuclear-localized protein n=1 Tax=Riccia fluitans TaxID=41844 RepID=A0ABD1Z691_9MARC
MATNAAGAEAPLESPTQANTSSVIAAEATKKKRGRPKKVKDNSEIIALAKALGSPHTPVAMPSQAPEEITLPSPPLEDDAYGSAQKAPTVVSDDAAPTSVKRGRGRPPKNQEDRKSSLTLLTTSGGTPGSSAKRPRGRPKGSGTGKKQESKPTHVPDPPRAPPVILDGIDRDATPLSPQLLQINAGEDIARIITSFCQKASRPIYVISASGTVSYVELKNDFPARGGTIVHQDTREILSMSGYYIPADNHSWSSRLSVTLGDKKSGVIGGGVSGCMLAASRVQVIVGSFDDTIPGQDIPHSEGA